MAVVEELIRKESDGNISFGNHLLAEKAKKEDFEHDGDLYKVKTFSTMTKLEKNGMFIYESVPGTSVRELEETASGMKFLVNGKEDAQITVGLEDDTEYEVLIADRSIGKMKTNLGGKLSFGVEMSDQDEVAVEVRK